MGVTVIDRREDPPEDKFGTDRQRFLERHRDLVKKAVSEQVAKGSIRDFEADGVVVPIPKETILEPVVHHGNSGNSNRVFPGLIKYEVGDQIPKPEGGGGGGGGGNPSTDGEGQDDFIWLSPEELLSILFEGRRLPDMTKFKAPETKIMDREHAGYTNKGPAHKLDMDITNRKRAGEALILGKMGAKRVLENLTEQYNIYASYKEGVPQLGFSGQSKNEKLGSVVRAVKSLKKIFSIHAGTDEESTILPLLNEAVEILKGNIGDKVDKEADKHRLEVLEARLAEQIKSRKDAGRYRPEHLTYKYDDDVPKPAAKAVLFCKMDVSASMTQERKNAAKSFFWLMNKFLTTKYENVDIVFIAHTQEAEEVDEQTFFYGTETGGTIVSTCLEKAKEIIAARYPTSEWNIYGVQASDGENYEDDNPKVIKFMKDLLPLMQSYYYIQIDRPSAYFRQPLLPIYKNLAKQFPNRLFTAEINNSVDAVEAFKFFFPSDGNTPTQPSFSP